MNNLNEDIKILERMLKIEKECLHYDVSQDEIRAIEHLIKAYKELKENSIPVSLVEETIEELNRKEQELQNSISDEEREEYSDANISFELMDIEIKRSILEELLEKRK